ncbi:MAG: coenzyme F420-0:L-glutamate ligase [Candidatus Thorarchaeota archaeon]
MMNSQLRMTSPMITERIEIIPLKNFPIVNSGDNIPELINSTLKENEEELHDGDILVISHSIVSIAEGSVYTLSEVVPSDRAKQIATGGEHSEHQVEVALRESTEVIREKPVLITKTKQGFITDYSGVDESNAPKGTLIALPKDPDHSASQIHRTLSDSMGFDVPVIITDTQGRPWRKGAVNLVIGLAGFSPFIKNEGKQDIHGKTLKSSLVCIADEIAASTELVMGQADEKVPIAIVRGINLERNIGSAREILRSDSESLFR